MKPAELVAEARELVRVLGLRDVRIGENGYGVWVALPVGGGRWRYENCQTLADVCHAFGLPSPGPAWPAV